MQYQKGNETKWTKWTKWLIYTVDHNRRHRGWTNYREDPHHAASSKVITAPLKENENNNNNKLQRYYNDNIINELLFTIYTI